MGKKSLVIVIYTEDSYLIHDLLEKDRYPDRGDYIQISDQVKLEFIGDRKIFFGKKGQSGIKLYSIFFNFRLIFSSDLATGIAATWLYNKLKDKNVGELEIEKTQVEVNEEKIRRLMEEKLNL